VRIATIRRISQELDKPIAILQDLQGPKMRVGDLPKEGIPLKEGERILLAPSEQLRDFAYRYSEHTLIPMEVPNLAQAVKKGNRILLEDGHLELEVLDVKDGIIEAEVVLGGILYSHKGVNLPGVSLGIPCFTEKDRADLEFGLQAGVDAVAISFVHTAEDV